MKNTLAFTALILVAAACAGCSTSENPITPDKMEEIRQQEANERANFNPGNTPPKPTEAPQ